MKTSVGRVEATVYSPSGQECYVVDGKWTDALYLRRAGDAEEAGRCVWKRNELPVSTDRQFNFTSFAMMLNEVNNTHTHIHKINCDCFFSFIH